MPGRVKIDPRDECISDGLCINFCPEVFDWGDDGKSIIKPEWQVDGNIAEGLIPDDKLGELEDCLNDAVQSCPVQIIQFEKE